MADSLTEELFQQLPEGIRSRTEVHGHHIVWKGPLTRKGNYAQVRTGEQVRLAHRIAFEAIHGPLRGNELIKRTCDQQGCVNPYHYRRARNAGA